MTQQRRLNTEALFREAAKTVIAREGRDRFTTAQVAEEAGRSIGSFYTIWADRVALLDDLFPDRVEGLVSETENGGRLS